MPQPQIGLKETLARLSSVDDANARQADEVAAALRTAQQKERADAVAAQKTKVAKFLEDYEAHRELAEASIRSAIEADTEFARQLRTYSGVFNWMQMRTINLPSHSKPMGWNSGLTTTDTLMEQIRRGK
jgi:hypothetical protein